MTTPSLPVLDTWPPTTAQLKLDKAIKDDIDNDRFTMNLQAAISFIERVRPGEFNYRADPLLVGCIPDPPYDLKLGVLRLAERWYARVSSPEAMISFGDLGAGRVPSFDPDIDRQLGIGRYMAGRFA